MNTHELKIKNTIEDHTQFYTKPANQVVKVGNRIAYDPTKHKRAESCSDWLKNCKDRNVNI